MISGFMGGAVVGMAALIAAPAMAQVSPAGTWEIEMRDSRYEIALCGDGTALCATLVWLGKGADLPENRAYMNKQLIEAPPAGTDQWRGALHLFGHSAAVTITQVSKDEITARGCVFFVICRTYSLFRYAD